MERRTEQTVSDRQESWRQADKGVWAYKMDLLNGFLVGSIFSESLVKFKQVCISVVIGYFPEGFNKLKEPIGHPQPVRHSEGRLP